MTKTIKIAFYKVEFLKDKLPLYSFEELLKDLATYLDGDTNRQVIDVDSNGLETSIWFDYLNHKDKFSFDEQIYFLLAKDVKSIMKEDKKNNKLAHQENINDDIHLKIPSHFVYFPDKQIIGIEEMENAPTKAKIKNAIKKYLKIDIKFIPINRTNLIERLITFQDALETVEFDLKDFHKLVKNSEVDEFLKFINENNTQLKIKTYLESSKSKSFVVDLFSKLSQNTVENEILSELKNMKVTFKNEDMKRETIELINNLLVFRADREIYYNDLNKINDDVEKRLLYSKSVYETIIGFYNEYFS